MITPEDIEALREKAISRSAERANRGSTEPRANQRTIRSEPGTSHAAKAPISRIFDAAQSRFGDEVSKYIQKNPDRWPEWTREYDSFLAMLREDSDLDTDNLAQLAAWAVVGWIAFYDLKVIDGEGYREGLRIIWTEARRGDFKCVLCDEGHIFQVLREDIPRLCELCPERDTCPGRNKEKG